VSDAVFLFDRDHDLNVFASQAQAEGWMEAIDVEAGEYVAAYRQDGTRLTPTVLDRRVVLSPTGDVEPEALSVRLQEFAASARSAPQTTDPEAFAREWLAPRPRPRFLRWFARGGDQR
jgi:hypothetical protein